MIRTLFILLLFAGLFIQCKKETVTQTITKTDTVLVTVIDTVEIPAPISDTVTTFIVIRHAERNTQGTDPSLNADGQLRAEELKSILRNIEIQNIYSTSFNRTRETVTPLASDKGLTITEYSTSTPYAQLVKQFTQVNKGKKAVIVGHSNTVPEILKAFTSNGFIVTIAEDEYDNLFIVSLPAGFTPRVLHMKYGNTN